MTTADPDATFTALGSQRGGAEGGSVLTSEAMRAGAIVGRFSILELVGSGGLGEVFAAYDPDLDRKVALKFLRPGVGMNPAELADHTARLLREAQALAKVRHPNIVTVYEVGTHEGRVFIAMEFVRGETVSAWARRRQRHWTEVRDVIIPAGEAIAALHATGLVHRDFKPQNIMVEPDGRVVVLDFGLTRASGRPGPAPRSNNAPLLHEDLTEEGALAGTLPYMAPELLRSAEASPATDQFAFCVTLYEVVYGARPFVGRNLDDYQRLTEEGPPQTHDPRVPRWLRSVITRGLDPNPDQRYGSMGELLVALRRSQIRRRRRVLAGVAVVVLSLGTGAVASSAYDQDVTQEQRDRLEEMASEARAAAASGHYFVPPVDDPQGATALARVLELEAVKGPQAELAREIAAQLRQEMSEALVELGDDYAATPGGEAFAGDFYTAALLFDPSHERAREHAPVTIAQLGALERAAAAGEFTPAQRVAYEPMTILADEQPARRAKRAAALRKHKRGLSASTQEQLRSVLGTPTSPIPGDPIADARPAAAPTGPAAAQSVPGAAPSEAAPSEAAPSEPSPKADPEAAKAIAKAGRAAYSRGDFDEAAQKFHRALQLDRRNRTALEGLADVNFQRGRYSQAVNYYKRAVRQSPKSAPLHVKLGDAYLSVLRYDDALKAYRSAAKLGNAKARDRVALVEARLGAKKD